MATPFEMIAKQLIKAAGLDPDVIMQHVEEIKSMISGGYAHAVQANRRLKRIETHLGLSDIEPLHAIAVITHVQPDTLGDVASVDGRNEPSR